MIIHTVISCNANKYFPGVDLFVKMLVAVGEVVEPEDVIDVVSVLDDLNGMTNKKEMNISLFVRFFASFTDL